MTITTTLAKITVLAPDSAALIGAFVAMGSGAPAGADPLPYGPNTCAQGFVWREASQYDETCVTPGTRAQTAQQNSLAAQNREPNGGAYGTDTCKQGFVWREAFVNDRVCVVPADRAQAASDNSAAPTYLAVNAPAAPAHPTGPIDGGVNQMPVPEKVAPSSDPLGDVAKAIPTPWNPLGILGGLF